MRSFSSCCFRKSECGRDNLTKATGISFWKKCVSYLHCGHGKHDNASAIVCLQPGHAKVELFKTFH